MENNQHSNSESSAPEKRLSTSFNNEQPGQQLPTGKSKENLDKRSTKGNEQHSESSKPEDDNETLGTP